jgi:hypothetical protein
MNQPADTEHRMCFEILGFDIILDAQGKPYLLEVNQAPSFSTDSCLDYDVKSQVFKDTFLLLNLSLDKKRHKLEQLQQRKLNKIYQRQLLKDYGLSKKEDLSQKEENALLGQTNFMQAYPSTAPAPGPPPKPHAHPLQQRLNQLPTLQSRYEEMLRMRQEVENSISIKTLLRLEEERKVLEKEARRKKVKEDRLRNICRKNYLEFKER